MDNTFEAALELFKRHLIERVRERLVTRFSPDVLYKLDANVRFDLVSSQIIVMFEKSVVKSEIEKIVQETMTEVPTSWFDHLLLALKDKLPLWLAKKLKPKTEKIVTHRTETYNKVCPHVSLPNGQHYSWLVTPVSSQVFKDADRLVFPDLLFHVRELGFICQGDSRFDPQEHDKILTQLHNYLA